MLAVVETHPVQYHAPVYRAVQQEFGIPVTAIYGSDFSVTGFRDREFGTTFAWDTDLLSGYSSTFLASGSTPATSTSAFQLARMLRRIAPEVILLVGYSPLFYQLAFATALWTRRRLLLRAETADHAVFRSRSKRLARDAVLRTLYRACSKLLYVGQQSYRHYKRLGCSENKLVFSPYCVDTSSFELDDAARTRLRATTRQALGIAHEAKVLLLAGKVVQRKRPDLLIRAISELSTDLRQAVHVLVLGDGDMRETVAQLALEATPRIPISFVGFKNQTQLSAYYHAADLLVLPSESHETWGLVVNEALHHGLPCVVSDAVGCAADLIEPAVTGEVFIASSSDSLAAAIERATSLLGRSETRQACCRKASGYSVTKAAAGIANAYSDVICQS